MATGAEFHRDDGAPGAHRERPSGSVLRFHDELRGRGVVGHALVELV